MSSLVDYTLHLADNALILGHRNSEWTGHGPILEQDIALSNIALDLIGQARYFYQYAATLMQNANKAAANISEDDLAYLRNEREFKNCLLTEQENGDWGNTILREFFFSAFQYSLFDKLKLSADKNFASIAEKSLKEVTYHLRWSGEWVIRLGDGTAESHSRMLLAVEKLWPFTGELFIPARYEEELAAENITVDPSSLKDAWTKKVAAVFDTATLPYPGEMYMHTGGKTGTHTEKLGYLLAEMQVLQRSYPGATW